MIGMRWTDIRRVVARSVASMRQTHYMDPIRPVTRLFPCSTPPGDKRQVPANMALTLAALFSSWRQRRERCIGAAFASV